LCNMDHAVPYDFISNCRLSSKAEMPRLPEI
jgi:hypothetical protein